MIKFAHIIMIPMTGVGINGGYKSDEWFKNRLEIFKKYTLSSLMHQTNRQFLVWLTFRPQEEKNPMVKELGQYLNEIKMPTLMTFHGLMYHDDKFSKGIRNKVMNAGRVVRQAWREKRPSMAFRCGELFLNRNKSLLKRLDRAIYEVQKFPEFRDANYIFLTRIDSDDMFRHSTVQAIQDVGVFEGAITCGNGFVYNDKTGEMAEWQPKTNPPFHTIVFRNSIFFNPNEHLGYYKDFHSHEDIPKVFPTKSIGEGRYCVVVHGNHISTVFDHPFKGNAVDPKLIKEFV